MTSLKHTELRWSCPLPLLEFKSTKEVPPLTRIVGQDRALEAIRLGVQIKSQGYNIYASGVTGTGRLTTVRQILEEMGNDGMELFDFAYVNNFKQPDVPVLLRFHAGEGRVFDQMMNDALTVIKRRIPLLFDDETFQTARKAIIQKFQNTEKSVLTAFDTQIRPAGFVIGQLQEEDGTTRTEIFPLVAGKPHQLEELEELVEAGTITMDQAGEIHTAYIQFKEQLNEIGRRSMRMMVDFRRELSRYDQNEVGALLKSVFDDVRLSFSRDRVNEFLNGVSQHLLEHLEELIRLFQAQQAPNTEVASQEAIAQFFRLYSVNVIVDNYDCKRAPVVIETSPTYTSLFGTIERRLDPRGVTVSDFTNVKAGSILRADGGTVVLNVVDVLSDPQIWAGLKRVMLYSRVEIQSTDTQFQLNTLKPEWIKVNVKIILLGDPDIYLALWNADEDFHKMFKVHAEFATDTTRTNEMIRHYVGFFARMVVEESLLHCDRSGAAALIEWAVEYTESQEKITLQFSYVADLLREASFYARAAKAKLITRTHVQHAIDQRHRRSNRADETIREHIRKGILLIDVASERVGQINGLSVYSTGIVSFGKPSRITATVSAGNQGIINIEREVAMSGPIHSKGVLILSGLLRSLFSRSQHISFTASIAFEQSYGGVDGDSASAAEVIALLSAISNIPITQEMAITGSINQKGDIQPIGGVNEKITGFFEVCNDKGLTGRQGVLIPKQNVSDLMLRGDVVEAVRKKLFSIIPIGRLEDAVQLMMGLPAGRQQPNGTFPKGTVYAKVQQNLDVLHTASRHAHPGT